ncbi:DegT/DnrJ/EryC1/StrS family aminotransferase [Candidatus Magnetomonas plexicatena]|uniref:DegT/DnrJ/EryC1/StrS family aminotransferase n=1 Tax=Candidatus Magnetomonas plexicatena TaxID=2552947 RepID=UPI001102A4E0|nr:DegT/DnrJ/EryC1/StrS family aminotransferase [Nitrospirales bacterium LBB_01]
MKIPFGTISVTEKSKELIREILEKNRLSSGKYVREFENKFAALTGVKESVTVSTGTDALALALAVLYDYGAKRGDEIIVPALSFVATANAVLQAGFTPVFVDVQKETLNIDTNKIETAITEKTRAILPVHLMGKPAEMDTIIKIAKAHRLLVIEDAAEAHGAVYKGKKAGAMADMGCFSLYVAHIITTVEGGIVTTDNEDYAEILRSLRSHGRACKCKSCVLNTASAYCSKRFEHGEDIRFYFERVGFSSKMNELEAAIGIGNLDIYDEILTKRRENLYYLMNALKAHFSSYIYTITKEEYEEIGPHALPIIIKEGAKFVRQQLIDFFEKKEIDTRTLFSSMPTQCRGYEYLGYKTGDFPVAEYVGLNGIHIGVHQDITLAHCEYIIETLNEFLSQYS